MSMSYLGSFLEFILVDQSMFLCSLLRNDLWEQYYWYLTLLTFLHLDSTFFLLSLLNLRLLNFCCWLWYRFITFISLFKKQNFSFIDIIYCFSPLIWLISAFIYSSTVFMVDIIINTWLNSWNIISLSIFTKYTRLYFPSKKCL